jgi:hypothetical protein
MGEQIDAFGVVEGGESVIGTAAETLQVEPKPTARPRARRPETPPEAPAAPGIFGRIPPSSDRFSIQRVTLNGGYEPLSFPTPDGQAEVSQFPMVDLTLETIRERWGAGEFRVRFFRAGGRHHIVYSPHVRIRDVKAAEAAPAVKDPMAEAIAMMRLSDERANQSLRGVVELAALLSGNQKQSGVTAEMLQLILDRQNERFERVISEMRTDARTERDEHRRTIEDLRREMREGAGTPAENAALAAVAGVAPKLYRRGMTMGDLIKAMMAENPEILSEAIKAGMPILQTVLTKIMVAQQAPAPVRRLAPVSRETLPREPLAPVHEPAAAPSRGPGLNGATMSQATPEAAAPPAATPPPTPAS